MANKKKTTTEKKKTKQKEQLLILSDLVEASNQDYAVMVGCLVEADLYQQYLQELDCKSHNLPVQASITQNEFDKVTKLLGDI